MTLVGPGRRDLLAIRGCPSGLRASTGLSSPASACRRLGLVAAALRRVHRTRRSPRVPGRGARRGAPRPSPRRARPRAASPRSSPGARCRARPPRSPSRSRRHSGPPPARAPCSRPPGTPLGRRPQAAPPAPRAAPRRPHQALDVLGAPPCELVQRPRRDRRLPKPLDGIRGLAVAVAADLLRARVPRARELAGRKPSTARPPPGRAWARSWSARTARAESSQVDRSAARPEQRTSSSTRYGTTDSVADEAREGLGAPGGLPGAGLRAVGSREEQAAGVHAEPAERLGLPRA